MVARDKHSLNGATLDVNFEMCESDEEKGKTIQVAGLASSTTEDSILNYFENKRRSGGEEVEKVDLRKETGMAFVTFKDANGRQFILMRYSCLSYKNTWQQVFFFRFLRNEKVLFWIRCKLFAQWGATIQ